MKKILLILFSLLLCGCPNDKLGPEPELTFEFKNVRVEKLEDAFFKLNLESKEITTSQNIQNNERYPTFRTNLRKKDTIVGYEIQFKDCQGFRELAIGSNWNCDNSEIYVMDFESNKTNVTDSIAILLFNKNIKAKIDSILLTDKTNYSWQIKTKGDSTIITTYDQNKRIRKERIFGIVKDDSTSNYENLNLLQINDYRKDSIYQYVMDKSYYYLRISKINTLPNNGYK